MREPAAEMSPSALGLRAHGATAACVGYRRRPASEDPDTPRHTAGGLIGAASSVDPLLADAQSRNQRAIAVEILALQVVEQAPALADEPQEPAARVVIFRVGLEVLGEVID